MSGATADQFNKALDVNGSLFNLCVCVSVSEFPSEY